MKTIELVHCEDYVLWLRSLTHSELRNEFPNRISEIVFKGNVEDSVNDFFLRDAQLYGLICDYAKLLNAIMWCFGYELEKIEER